MGTQGAGARPGRGALGLSWRVEGTGRGPRVVMFGALDRHVDLSELARLLPPGPLELHLGAVSKIDAFGVRAWLSFRELLGARPLALTHLAPPVVDAVNQVTGFAPRGAVRSLYAVWACARCRRADERLVEVAIDQRVPPEPRCDRCLTPLTLADLPARVWHFLD